MKLAITQCNSPTQEEIERMKKLGSYKGIDYSMPGSCTNRDADSGIHYGVIPMNEICQAWSDSSEAQYPEDLAEDEECDPSCFTYEGEGIAAQQSHDSPDVWVFKSPYFTYAQFCSPCAPGACYLLNPCTPESGAARAYCFGHDWFEEGIAPYPVYSVETGAELIAKKQDVACERCGGSGIVMTAELAKIRKVTRSELERDLKDVVITDHSLKCWVCNGKKTVNTVVITECNSPSVK
jgi:hypothetical protein